MKFWKQSDGTFSTVAPPNKDIQDRTPMFFRSALGDWYYSDTNQSKLLRCGPTDTLPKEIQLHLFLLGEE